jgi:AraC family transcriptional regulator
VPENCDVYSQSNSGGEYLRIALEEPSAANRLVDRRFTDIVDIPAMKAAHEVRRSLISRNATDPLSIKRLVGVLTVRVARILGGEHKESREAAWMTPRRLRLVDDIIEERLDCRLTVHELAAGLGRGLLLESMKRVCRFRAIIPKNATLIAARVFR